MKIVLYEIVKDSAVSWIAGGAAVATMIAVSYALLKDTLWSYWRRPHFNLEARNDKPWLTSCTVGQPRQRQCRGFCQHISVKNEGRSKARSCTVELTEVWSEHHEHKGKFEKRTNHIPYILEWSFESGVTDINRLQTKFINIGYIIQDKDHHEKYGLDEPDGCSIYYAKTMPDGVLKDLEAGKKHRFCLTVHGDNFKPCANNWYELDLKKNWWDGLSDDWKNARPEWTSADSDYDYLKRHFTIRPSQKPRLKEVV